MSRIFISHSSKEHDFAQRLVGRLEKHDLPCWIAPRDIPPSDDFQRALVDAIGRCDVVLLLVSANSNQSEEIARELALARRAGKRIVPARIEDVQPEAALAYQTVNAQWVDLYKDYASNVERLMAELGKMLSLSEQVAAAKLHLARRRRMVRFGLSAGVAAAAGAVLMWAPHLPALRSMALPGFAAAVAGPSPTPVAPAPVASVTAPASLATPIAADALKPDVVDQFVTDYYGRMSRPESDVLSYLAGVVADPVHFYGKVLDRQHLLENERAYLETWPQRNFSLRPDTVASRCDVSGTDCMVSGTIDYDVRNRNTDLDHWGVERFSMRVLKLGDAVQITALGGEPVERHTAAASSRPIPKSATQ